MQELRNRPFLKWVGSKYSIVNKIKELLPPGKKLIEPFVGSAAVFLNTNFNKYILADNNFDLINIYQYLTKDKEKFIKYCSKFFTPKTNTKKIFLQYRELFNTAKDLRLKAALFLYLNKHAYNGLMRYNQSGLFNSPFGKYKGPVLPAEAMLYFAEKSINATIKQLDFIDTLNLVRPGDVVYCDPPYIPLSETARFTSYSAINFGEAEQTKLAKLSKNLAENGVTVILSNHDTPFIRHIYKGSKIQTFNVQRMISCNVANRNKVAEILAIFYPKG